MLSKPKKKKHALNLQLCTDNLNFDKRCWRLTRSLFNNIKTTSEKGFILRYQYFSVTFLVHTISMYVWYVVYIYLLFTQVSTYLSKTMGPCHIKSATEKKQQGKKNHK